MADHDDAPEKIKCLECGKEFSFLAPHLSKAHQMNARQYRERWGIPLHRPLASAEHSRQCRENVLRRIRRGEIRPADQLALMAEGRKNAPERATSTRLHKVAAANVARVHQIWKHSPLVKVVPDTLRDEAVQRMTARKVTGEKVKDIAADLNLSVGCLYKWVASAK
ncbi:ROS/MUCR transcriptional regulator domain protein [Salmonella enterica]|nr:ROS/MUCR transcriptional regulator domain protein [Salmonella enterica]